MRNFADFEISLRQPDCPENISPCLQALWHDAKNEWEKAHSIIQDINDNNASWIHAYLHRREGDIWNANYWYTRAGKTMPDCSLKDEWQQIVQSFLPHGNDSESLPL